MTNTRIVILDEHPTYRVGLRTIVEEHTRYDIVDEIDSVSVREDRVLAVQPNLIVMDASADGSRDVDFIRWIRAEEPEIRLFIHTDSPSLKSMQFFLRQGVRGYTTKNLPALTLIHGLDTVARGGTFVCMQTTPGQHGEVDIATATQSHSWRHLLRELTPRERQVLDIILQGRQTKEIALELDISPRTVENHRSNIMKKLSLHSQVDLVLYAARIGLIEV
ncbi:MAG: response regulator [Spirochaetes bacterium]|jgi:DNA-binding NarL/FixJ family response regulator|nr:response regulator [Spirochaetota bacterium]